MCNRCNEIDVQIAYFKQRLASLDDRTAIAVLNMLIADLETDKITLHPKDKQGRLSWRLHP
jgi:hypothetical protein